MHTFRKRQWVFGLSIIGLFAAAPAFAVDDAKAELAKQAQAILKNNCHKCHGQNGAAEGGFNYILDLNKLVTHKKVVPGDPDQSLLFKKVSTNKMPPPAEKTRPSENEIAILKKWIEAGAPSTGPVIVRAFLSESDLVDLMLADLEKLDRRSRRFVRYFTLTHLYNSGLSEDELQTYRVALSKLLNSLSWHPKIANPKPIDPNGTILRIDLRDYMWDANLWNRMLQDYPYGVLHDTATARAVYVNSATRMPYLRADWFLATASRPPLYHDLLQLPGSAAELERLVRVDVAVNIQQDRVARAGFNGSGVAINNRLIERHDAIHGAYWKSYDFEAVPNVGVEKTNLIPDRRNLFAYPLGPGQLENNFLHAGGEIIYNLPNGLQAYMLIDAQGRRIDKAPTNIVSDPKRPDRAVENGLSCIYCHYNGILPKSDQIRGHVEKNKKAYAAKDYELILALYSPEAKMNKLIEEDSDRFLKALEKTGVKVSVTEPITFTALRYEGELDLIAAAAEFGLKPEELLDRIGGSETLGKNLGPLRSAGGTIKREVLVAAFGDAIKETKIGTLFQAASGLSLPDNTGEIDPLEGASSSANAMLFIRGGKIALFASADKTIRVWDVERGIELRRCIGHTASVWCLAVSPNEKWALSGSADGTVRYWKIDTGEEVKKLEGHTAIVTAVAFAADGSQAISAGYDQQVIVWDLKTFKETARIKTAARYVNALAFDAKRNRVLVAGDNRIHVVDFAENKEIKALEGHTRSVVCLSVSSDGKFLLSGSDDRTMRLWDLEKLEAVRTYEGHSAPIKSVAFAPNGRLLMSASADSTVRVWDASSNKSLRTFTKHGEGVVQAVFLNDTGSTITGSKESNIKLWQLPKAVLTATEPAVKGELKPAVTVPLGATLSHMILSPNGKWLYALNLPDRKLLKFDTAKLEKPVELQLADGVEAIAISPDGKTLFAVTAVRKNVVDRLGTRIRFAGEVQVIDPAKMEIEKSVAMTFAMHEVIAVDDKTILVLGRASEDDGLLYSIDLTKENVTGSAGPLSARGALRLSSDRSYVYVSNFGAGSDIQMLQLPLGNVIMRSVPRFLNENSTGGEIVVSGDGQMVLSPGGTALQPNGLKNKEAKLKGVGSIDPFLTAVIDTEAAVIFALGRDSTLKHYMYPDLNLRGVFAIDIVGYQSVYDPKTGRLYVAVFNPKASSDKPLARGLGDLFVFDMKPVLEGKAGK